MSKEQLFYQTLQDIFIGAEVEGKGGFIKLMRIKSKYYKRIEDLLKADINQRLERYPSFREELFDKLYTFFKYYFAENGSIYFNQTSFHNNIYEKVYSNEKDIVLFWKTQMLYYVKTDRIFRSMPIEIDNLSFFFDASTIENKKANEKRSLIYSLKEVKTEGYNEIIVFEVLYAEKGRVTPIEDILKGLKKYKIKITEEQLERAFRIFERQAEVDYFIHKNAKAFLQEQFKLWLYQYYWQGAEYWHVERVNQLQILKDIAFKIIDFIAQFEDELVKIWNKPKFVKNSHYVITLDRIAAQPSSTQVLQKIVQHPNVHKQVEEWQKLEMVPQTFNIDDIFVHNLIDQPQISLKPEYQFLPIDTHYFKDIEQDILALFSDLDNSLDGWLIKSENYQALNTLLPKFKNKVQTIYIDPPFNLDNSTQFLYNTNYKDSTWATLLENRIRIAKEWLNEKGSIFVRCDYNGNWIVRPLLDDIFGRENFRNELILRKVNYQGTNVPDRFNPACESLYFFSCSNEIKFKQIFKEREREAKWINAVSPKENKNANYIVIEGRTFIAPKNSHWRFSQEKFNTLNLEKRIRINEDYAYIDVLGNPQRGIPQYLEAEYTPIDSNWTDISSYSFGWNFSTENSESILNRVIQSTSQSGDYVMDFFLGSGTTVAVAHKLGRKWIGIEMGAHFYTVVLPRMKKVLFYDKSGISQDNEVKAHYNAKQAGGFFKYYELEQYEETLEQTVYQDYDLFSTSKSAYEQYVFLKDEKLLKAIELDESNKVIKVDLNKIYSDIDLAECISLIRGKWIKAIKADKVVLENGEEYSLEDIDFTLIKPFIWWE